MKSTFFLLLASSCIFVTACDIFSPGPGRSVSELRAAPTTATLAGVDLRLEAYVYRDFMPISPPDGKPMIAGLRVETRDASDFPGSVHADSAWVIFKNDVWAEAVQEEITFESDRSFREWVIREGPKWGPDVYVDVVVKLVDDSGSMALLRAPDQLVGRTD